MKVDGGIATTGGAVGSRCWVTFATLFSPFLQPRERCSHRPRNDPGHSGHPAFTGLPGRNLQLLIVPRPWPDPQDSRMNPNLAWGRLAPAPNRS